MSKFNYKFKSVKNVKKNLEIKAQKDLSDVDLQIESVRMEIEKLNNEKQAIKAGFNINPKVKISEIQSRIYYENFIDGLVISLNTKIAELEVIRAKRLEVLAQKSKEHKIFQTLEEKHLEAFIAIENKAEQILIDDVAGKRFIRSKN